MITIIVAYNNNYVIANDKGIPWHIKEDLQFFKETTMGFPCIMGRKTWDSLPKKPLPGRKNIVVSRSGLSIEEAIKQEKDAFVIGGGEVYSYCINNNLVDRILASEIDDNQEGTVFFPRINWNKTIIKTFSNFKVVEYFCNNKS